MRKIIIALGFLCFGFLQAQDRVLFSYDNAGNQTLRKLCINCGNVTKNELQEQAAIEEFDYQKFYEEDQFSYYPNPVEEILYLKWELINGVSIQRIDLYSISGKLMNSLTEEILKGKTQTSLLFNNLPSSTYLVKMLYTDGREKSITIIKK